MKAFGVYKHQSLKPYGQYLSVIRECAKRFERRYAFIINGRQMTAAA